MVSGIGVIEFYLNKCMSSLTKKGLVLLHGIPKGCNVSCDSISNKSVFQNNW